MSFNLFNKTLGNSKNCCLLLLQIAKCVKMYFQCFCKLQKGRKRIFYVFANCKSSKNEFFVVLQTANGKEMYFLWFCKYFAIKFWL